LTGEQLQRGLQEKASLADLHAGGAALVAGGEDLSPEVRLYPLGTAAALARILAEDVDLASGSPPGEGSPPGS
jgi:hypothetical protein